MEKAVFWHRRDLRLEDNHGLSKATTGSDSVYPIFIFDQKILESLSKDDRRVSIIQQALFSLNKAYNTYGSKLHVLYGDPKTVILDFVKKHNIDVVYTNEDYEPYALKRDKEIYESLKTQEKSLKFFKDQVIFSKNEILNKDKPYKVYTHYSKLWLKKFSDDCLNEFKINTEALSKIIAFKSISIFDKGFISSESNILPHISNQILLDYKETRNFPFLEDGTSKSSVYLRFGLISVRNLIKEVKSNSTLLGEFIWREFFQMLLWHHPSSIDLELKAKYRGLPFENNYDFFEAWKKGKTGYPIVDAGMRELNATGLMHNRVRMITASFLIKHLCIDWRWGEAYFAEKLLDFDLASNVGNWQWVAGCGSDSAPYFRVFNPTLQQQKFDPNFEYIKKWVPEYGTSQYVEPIVNHKEAREKILQLYKKHLQV